MNKHYESEFKKKIVRLHLEEGRTLNGLAAEYGIAKASISRLDLSINVQSNPTQNPNSSHQAAISCDKYIFL